MIMERAKVFMIVSGFMPKFASKSAHDLERVVRCLVDVSLLCRLWPA
jgi:hypothetical protein